MTKRLVFPVALWPALLSESFAKIEELSRLKGAEYSGDANRLENFVRVAEKHNVEPELPWSIFVSKHLDAITTYINDTIAGKDRQRMEPIDGRIDDVIVYMLLFKAMVITRRGNLAALEARARFTPVTTEVTKPDPYASVAMAIKSAPANRPTIEQVERAVLQALSDKTQIEANSFKPQEPGFPRSLGEAVYISIWGPDALELERARRPS